MIVQMFILIEKVMDTLSEITCYHGICQTHQSDFIPFTGYYFTQKHPWVSSVSSIAKEVEE